VPGVGLYFASLEFINNSFHQRKTSSNEKLTPFQALSSGIIARTFVGTILIPFTVIKTRFESGKYSYKSTFDASRSILNYEGAKGLYIGLIPTLIRDAPFSGIYYMFYSQLKHIVSVIPQVDSISNTKFDWLVPFVCGLMSGTLASIITHPADVIKTKMQLKPAKHTRIVETCKKVINQKGLLGFLTGLTPRLIRRTLMASMTWTYFESLMKFSSA